jgi:hypothetical protein
MHLVTDRTHGCGIDRGAQHRDDRRMDLSELSSRTRPVKSESSAYAAAVTDGDTAWGLASQLAAEVASGLTPALDSVRRMQATGRIDRAGLHDLVARIEQARHAAMLGQQIARLSQGGIQQQSEPVNLTHALRDVLAQRVDELNARCIAVKQSLKPAEVVVDATLLSALLNTLIDWTLRHACTPLDLRLGTKTWPTHAQLVCRYGHRPPDQVPPAASTRTGDQAAAALDCLSWQLLVQLARIMPLQVDRVDSATDTTLTLEFPHTANDGLECAAAAEWHSGSAGADAAQQAHDTQVLVIALRREILNQVRQTVSHMKLGVQCVSSIDAARELCQQALPQAIVYESTVYDSAFDALRNDIRQQCPGLAWVEIVDEGDAFEISSFDGVSMARVGRDAIASSLPAALLFELSRRP